MFELSGFRSSGALLLMLALLPLCALVLLVVIYAGHASADADLPVHVGLAHVPAKPVPGAKDRTPVNIETLLAGNAAGAALEELAFAQALEQLESGKLDAWAGVMAHDATLPAGIKVHRLDWSAGPMATMRTDTDIRSWQDLRGRTVCLSADGRFVGEMAARFGAIEQIYGHAADALLGVRIGECDATVQDESFLHHLLQFPEWKKFSATLKPYREAQLVLLQAPAGRSASNRLADAFGRKLVAKQAETQARDIAFEVYMDQVVPDCH